MATMPTRIDSELFDAARSAGEASSRSAAQQLNHWASIGRALEESGTLSYRDIQRVLAGDGSYDAMAEREQAVVRATWDEQISDGIADLDFERELTSADESWSEADDEGRVVVRNALRR
jgi:glycine/D-amino acid oxidase-like deaminating enzyme